MDPELDPHGRRLLAGAGSGSSPGPARRSAPATATTLARSSPDTGEMVLRLAPGPAPASPAARCLTARGLSVRAVWETGAPGGHPRPAAAGRGGSPAAVATDAFRRPSSGSPPGAGGQVYGRWIGLCLSRALASDLHRTTRSPRSAASPRWSRSRLRQRPLSAAAAQQELVERAEAAERFRTLCRGDPGHRLQRGVRRPAAPRQYIVTARSRSLFGFTAEEASRANFSGSRPSTPTTWEAVPAEEASLASWTGERS